MSANLQTRGSPVGKRWSKATDSSVEGRMDKQKDCSCKADGCRLEGEFEGLCDHRVAEDGNETGRKHSGVLD